VATRANPAIIGKINDYRLGRTKKYSTIR